MLRRLGPRGDGGAGFAEYAGLVVLAALILGALYAGLKTTDFQGKLSAAICQIVGGQNCGKPQASGQDKNDGGQETASPSPGRTGGDQGDQPSLADLQKKADGAQKSANDANGKYGNIKQQIIDLLKDFIGITDIEECITKGSISSCLWAAFDVASWVFAALKIAKFAKAVKDAIKLWKVYNKGRKIIDRAKDAAKRAKDLLKRKKTACGIPVGYTYPNAPPGRVVFASVVRQANSCGLSGKALAKAEKLPTKGKVRFVPPKKLANGKLARGRNGGALDRFGNEWVKGPSRTKGQDFEWDVQLTPAQQKNWQHLYAEKGKKGKITHLNISLDGKITHVS